MPRQKPKYTRKEKEQKPPREDLIKRIKEAKEHLPKSGVTSFFLQLNPEYDNVKGKSRLQNVLQLKITDEEVTEKVEALARLMTIPVVDAEVIN